MVVETYLIPDINFKIRSRLSGMQSDSYESTHTSWKTEYTRNLKNTFCIMALEFAEHGTNKKVYDLKSGLPSWTR